MEWPVSNIISKENNFNKKITISFKMWKPNDKGLHELLNLFKDSNSNDNRKQSQIYTVRPNLICRKSMSTRATRNSPSIWFLF